MIMAVRAKAQAQEIVFYPATPQGHSKLDVLENVTPGERKFLEKEGFTHGRWVCGGSKGCELEVSKLKPGNESWTFHRGRGDNPLGWFSFIPSLK